MVALISAVGLIYATMHPGLACTVCIPIPEKTVADRLIESEIVLLAREDPDRPFSYASVEVLKGVHDGAPIDLFLDSTTRRRLARSPERTVVLAHVGDGWLNLGYADAAYEQVVREIIDSAADWEGTDGSERVEYFAGLLDHDERIIANLAYLEVGRAPYRAIKSVSDRMKPDHMRRIITDIAYYEWRPLAILMLAHVGNDNDRRHIKRSFDSIQKHQTDRHLAAWATAYIEIEGKRAIERIEEVYLRNPERTEAELVEVSKALSLQGSNGHVHLRGRIVAAYATLLDTHTGMVGYVAKDLAAWEDWSLADLIREIVSGRDGLDSQTLFIVGYYLGLASEHDRHRGTTTAVR